MSGLKRMKLQLNREGTDELAEDELKTWSGGL